MRRSAIHRLTALKDSLHQRLFDLHWSEFVDFKDVESVHVFPVLGCAFLKWAFVVSLQVAPMAHKFVCAIVSKLPYQAAEEELTHKAMKVKHIVFVPFNHHIERYALD